MSIVAISGSPSANSRSAALLRHVLNRLSGETPREVIVLRDLPPQALVRAEFDDPDIRRALAQVASARLVVVATPIYKASFSGLLKTFLDLLPPDGLRGKTVLALGTGGTTAHLLALDYSLKPVLAALGARHILDTVFALDSQVIFDEHPVVPAMPSPPPEGGAAASRQSRTARVHDDVCARVDRALADGPFALDGADPVPLAA